MLNYAEFQVNKLLSPFVKKLWVLDNRANPAEVRDKAVLPNGCFTLAFIEGEGLEVSTHAETLFLGAGVYFCGQLTRAIKVNVRPRTKATMVQLFAWTAVHFTDADMESYVDRIVPFECACVAYTCPAICKAVYDHFKTGFRRTEHTVLVVNSCRLLQEGLAIGGIAGQLGCSVRHLQKQVKKGVGLSPKALAVIFKLRDAVDDIAYPEAERVHLTRLALTNNFYDQAHFNNTFQNIVHTSPGKFRASDYFLSLKK